MYALTSLPPRDSATTHRCLRSWRAAGLRPLAFQSPAEIDFLRPLYDDVEFVPVENTTEAHFGRPYVPANALISWAERQNETVLIINADIHLDAKPEDIEEIREASRGGLCCMIRHNYRTTFSDAQVEEYGFDAFMFHGRAPIAWPETHLSLGQPWWDWWLPAEFASCLLPVYCVDRPLAYHQIHAQAWDWDVWHKLSSEFMRLTGWEPSDKSFDGCMAWALEVRKHLGEVMRGVHEASDIS